jgi:hypothetical protein
MNAMERTAIRNTLLFATLLRQNKGQPTAGKQAKTGQLCRIFKWQVGQPLRNFANRCRKFRWLSQTVHYQPDIDAEELTATPCISERCWTISLVWMEEHGWPSLAEMRGNMSFSKVPDPDAYERANYMLMLQGWRA